MLTFFCSKDALSYLNVKSSAIRVRVLDMGRSRADLTYKSKREREREREGFFHPFPSIASAFAGEEITIRQYNLHTKLPALPTIYARLSPSRTLFEVYIQRYRA